MDHGRLDLEILALAPDSTKLPGLKVVSGVVR